MHNVIWRDSALNALAKEYVESELETRSVIEMIVTQWNSNLSQYPYEVGESRDGLRRIAFEGTYAISFLVGDPMGVVRVTHFWRI